MNPQRIAAKFFVSPDPTADVDVAPFTPLFHEFIQKASVPGLLIDVADYAHVPNGPGIILIGNEVDYGLDSVGGHAGLLVVRKRYGSASLGEILRDTLAKGLHCVKAIEDDGRTGLSFSLDAVEVQIFDRLAAPNDSDSYEAAATQSARDVPGRIDRGFTKIVDGVLTDPDAAKLIRLAAQKGYKVATIKGQNRSQAARQRALLHPPQ